MNEPNVNAIIVRAFKTFLQAFFATLAAGMFTTEINTAAVGALIVGGIAAGISAVMNLFLQPQEAK